MLPPAARLTRSADFATVIRSGRRAGSRRLVVHLLRSERPAAARAGFVVSAKVGNSVVRHRITRRLRPLTRALLADQPAGTDLVIRALPAAAGASSAELSDDLSFAVAAAARKSGAPR